MFAHSVFTNSLCRVQNLPLHLIKQLHFSFLLLRVTKFPASKVLHLNIAASLSCSNCFSAKSSPEIISSSTYTSSILNLPPCEFFKEKYDHLDAYLYSKVTIIFVNLSNHAWYCIWYKEVFQLVNVIFPT